MSVVQFDNGVVKIATTFAKDKAKIDEVMNEKNSTTHVGKDKEMESVEASVNLGGFRPKSKKALKRHIDAYVVQNENLEQSIDEKNVEIAGLQGTLEGLNESLRSLQVEELRTDADNANQKLVELTAEQKKYTRELDASKRKLQKTEAQLQAMRRSLEETQRQHNEKLDAAKRVPRHELFAKIEAMRQKYKDMGEKNVQYEKELKLMLQCLREEVGEDVNINLLAAQPLTQAAGARARQQEIMLLQQQMQELKLRIADYETQGDSSVGPSLTSLSTFKSETAIGVGREMINKEVTNRSASMEGASSHNVYFDRYKPSVRRDELLYRAKVDELQVKMTQLQAEIDAEESKIQALKVRNKTLHDGLVVQKQKVANFRTQQTDKSAEIVAGDEQFNKAKVQYENQLDLKLEELAQQMKLRQTAEREEITMRNLYEHTASQLTVKNEKIQELKRTIAKMETDLQEVAGTYLYSCRQLPKEGFVAILDTMETETKFLNNYEEELSKRLNTEVEHRYKLRKRLVMYKMRNARAIARRKELESRLKATQLDTDSSSDDDDYSTRMSKEKQDRVNALAEARANIRAASKRIKLLQGRQGLIEREKLIDAGICKEVLDVARSINIESGDEADVSDSSADDNDDDRNRYKHVRAVEYMDYESRPGGSL